MVHLLAHWSYLKDLRLQLQLRVHSYSLSFDGSDQSENLASVFCTDISQFQLNGRG